MRRHTRANRCPICDGGDGDPRGQGKRCNGFTSDDGEWVHCSREEIAGGLPQEDGGTYPHRMRGPCKCGAVHNADNRVRDEIEATYPYTDETGAVLYEVVRKTGKRFLQRKPDGAGGWEWKLNGVRRVPYRFRELVDDDGDRPVYIVEGEKDADVLAKRGHTATTNPGGAGKWSAIADVARTALQGRDVIVIADDDDVGRRHAREVAVSLHDVARSVRVTRCPSHKDVHDHLAAGATLENLVDLGDDDQGAATSTLIPPPDAEWRRLVVEPAGDWYTAPPPKRAWLLRDTRDPKARGVLPLGKVGQMIAEGGAGKTLALCQLAVAVATGTPWLGTFSAPEPGRVLLVLGEEDEEEARRRLYHAARVADVTPAQGAIALMPLQGVRAPMLERDNRGNVVEAPYLPWLREYVRAEDFRLVVVDPLSRFAGPDAETDNAAATVFIQALESLLSPMGTRCVLNAHHVNKMARGAGKKPDASSGRGSSGFVDGARWQCALSSESIEIDDPDIQQRLGEIVTLEFTKSNYSRRAPSLLLRRVDEHNGALAPVAAEDLEIVTRARGSDGRREAKQAQAANTEAERQTREDAALDAILTATDGPTSKRAVRAAMAAALGTCSHDRADAAIERRRQRCQ